MWWFVQFLIMIKMKKQPQGRGCDLSKVTELGYVTLHINVRVLDMTVAWRALPYGIFKGAPIDEAGHTLKTFTPWLLSAHLP